MIRRLALVALPLALLAGALSACTESTRIPPAEPTAEVAPLFATDEEALEAATAAYEEFLRVSSQILQDGGADPDRLRPLVSDEVYASEAEGFAALSQNDWKLTGSTELTGMLLQQHMQGPPGSAQVIAYACVTVAGTDVVDSMGVSQVEPDRVTDLQFEVVFASTDESSLLIERKTLWDEEVTC
jgi:hypothetical protein